MTDESLVFNYTRGKKNIFNASDALIDSMRFMRESLTIEIVDFQETTNYLSLWR